MDCLPTYDRYYHNRFDSDNEPKEEPEKDLMLTVNAFNAVKRARQKANRIKAGKNIDESIKDMSLEERSTKSSELPEKYLLLQKSVLNVFPNIVTESYSRMTKRAGITGVYNDKHLKTKIVVRYYYEKEPIAYVIATHIKMNLVSRSMNMKVNLFSKNPQGLGKLETELNHLVQDLVY